MVIYQKEYVRLISEALDSMSDDSNTLNESGLSRVNTHIKDHHIAIITRHRKLSGDPDRKEKNSENNKSLKAALREAGYGVTNMYGKYNETTPTGAVAVKEHSFLVVGPKKSGSSDAEDIAGQQFLEHIKQLGREGNKDKSIKDDESRGKQESILYKSPHSKNAFLHSTSSPGTSNTSWIDEMPDKKFNVGQFTPDFENPDGSSSMAGKKFSFTHINANPPKVELSA